jgi:hypothetical protein
MKAIEVTPKPGYKLKVAFDDGLVGEIDLSDFIKEGIFALLQNEEEFAKVYFTDYAVAWNDDLEIDLLAIYVELAAKSPDKLFTIPEHATN